MLLRKLGVLIALTFGFNSYNLAASFIKDTDARAQLEVLKIELERMRVDNEKQVSSYRQEIANRDQALLGLQSQIDVLKQQGEVAKGQYEAVMNKLRELDQLMVRQSNRSHKNSYPADSITVTGVDDSLEIGVKSTQESIDVVSDLSNKEFQSNQVGIGITSKVTTSQPVSLPQHSDANKTFIADGLKPGLDKEKAEKIRHKTPTSTVNNANTIVSSPKIDTLSKAPLSEASVRTSTVVSKVTPIVANPIVEKGTSNLKESSVRFSSEGAPKTIKVTGQTVEKISIEKPITDEVEFSEIVAKFKAQSYHEAQELLLKFKRKYPTSRFIPDVTFYLGSVYFLTDQTSKALKQIQLFVKNYPNHRLTGQAMINLALLQRKSNQLELATSTLKKIIQDFPGTPESQQAQSMLN